MSDLLSFKSYSKLQPAIVYIKDGKETNLSQKACCWQESQKKKSLNLLHLHLQSPQASTPRHRNLKEGYEHHELLHPRHLRQNCHRRIQARQIQQEKNSLIPRGPISCQAYPPRRTRQTCCLWRNQSRHQIHSTMILFDKLHILHSYLLKTSF